MLSDASLYLSTYMKISTLHKPLHLCKLVFQVTLSSYYICIYKFIFVPRAVCKPARVSTQLKVFHLSFVDLVD